MDPHPLTREAVIRTLGEVDDAIIDEVISTGATDSDLAIAIDRLRTDPASWHPDPPHEPHVSALYSVLEVWWARDIEPEYSGTD
jgi:hypothetical protein